MKTRPFRDVIKILKNYDLRFEVSNQRGKGSHRMIIHPDIFGKERHWPIPFHGRNKEILPGFQKGGHLLNEPLPLILRHFQKILLLAMMENIVLVQQIIRYKLSSAEISEKKP